MAENAEEEPVETLLVKIEERGQLMHEYPPEELAGKQARPQRSSHAGDWKQVSAESFVEECFFVDLEKRLFGKPSPLTELAIEMLPTAATAMRRMQLGSSAVVRHRDRSAASPAPATPDGKHRRLAARQASAPPERHGAATASGSLCGVAHQMKDILKRLEGAVGVQGSLVMTRDGVLASSCVARRNDRRQSGGARVDRLRFVRAQAPPSGCGESQANHDAVDEGGD
jgi:hypothetical protein